MLIGSRAARGVIAKSQYGAAKAALVGLARAWAKELAPRGITVNVVAPAATETAMLTDPARADIAAGGSRRRWAAASVPRKLRRWSRSCCPDAAAITGQEIAICGGASL